MNLTRLLSSVNDAGVDSLIEEQDLTPWRRFFIGETS